jgi:hypothetical protein
VLAATVWYAAGVGSIRRRTRVRPVGAAATRTSGAAAPASDSFAPEQRTGNNEQLSIGVISKHGVIFVKPRLLRITLLPVNSDCAKYLNRAIFKPKNTEKVVKNVVFETFFVSKTVSFDILRSLNC